MALRIVSKSEVSVAGGPPVKISQILPVDAYDVIDVAVSDNAADKVVEVQPAAVAAQVRYLLLTAGKYDRNLTYKVNTPAHTAHPLNEALIHVGEGAIQLLCFPPEKFLFSNATGSEISVQKLVGRDATP